MENGGRSRVILVAVVYLSLFLDNVLLTVVGKLFKPFIVEDLFLERYKTSCNWNNLIMNKKKIFQCLSYPITFARWMEIRRGTVKTTRMAEWVYY